MHRQRLRPDAWLPKDGGAGAGAASFGHESFVCWVSVWSEGSIIINLEPVLPHDDSNISLASAVSSSTLLSLRSLDDLLGGGWLLDDSAAGQIKFQIRDYELLTRHSSCQSPSSELASCRSCLYKWHHQHTSKVG